MATLAFVGFGVDDEAASDATAHLDVDSSESKVLDAFVHCKNSNYYTTKDFLLVAIVAAVVAVAVVVVVVVVVVKQTNKTPLRRKKKKINKLPARAITNRCELFFSLFCVSENF